jgi:hypothetical protein
MNLLLILLLSQATQVPPHLSYNETVQQLQKWEREYPNLVHVASIGKSSRGTPIYCLRLTNELDTRKKYRVLISMAIHGNEPNSSAMGMGFIGLTLKNYKEGHQFAKEMLNKREIYVIPVSSPDSYPHSRYVDGVDPNRNYYENPSVNPVECIKRFVVQMKFPAAIFGHTSGRVFFHPYADSSYRPPHYEEFRRVLNTMSKMSGYRVYQCYQNWNHPEYGVADDWCYRNFQIFAITYEFGHSHDRIPTYREIETEIGLVYLSMVYFVREAPVAFNRGKR